MDTVGSGCMSCSIPGMEDAGCIFLFGYNPADSHPIVARRIVRAKEKGCKIIVADPRHIETARIADIYLPIKNGCNVAFLNAFANCLVNDGLYDKESDYKCKCYYCPEINCTMCNKVTDIVNAK